MRLKTLEGDPTELYVVASMTQPGLLVNGAAALRMYRAQGFSQSPVHFIIDRDGVVNKPRTLDKRGFLAGSRNATALQVSLIGGIDGNLMPTRNFTPEQMTALEALSSELGLPVRFAPNFPKEKTTK